MMYARCKCGEFETWTSMGIRRCAWCKKCGTTPAYGKDGHKTVQPKHKMYLGGDDRLQRALEGARQTEVALRGKNEHSTAKQVLESLLKDMHYCHYCHLTRREIEQKNEPMDLSECVP